MRTPPAGQPVRTSRSGRSKTLPEGPSGVIRGGWVAWMLLAAAGCGGDGMPLGSVSGQVTYKGQVVPDGIICFVPEQGPAASSPIDAQGRYRLTTYSTGDGAVLGTHKVYFAPAGDTGGADENVVESAEVPPPPADPKYLPHKYRSPETSGLTREVQAGSNTFDFDLQDP